MGALVAIWCFVPAFLVFSGWQFAKNEVITQLVVSELPQEMRELPHERLVLVLNDIKNTVHGNIVANQDNQVVIQAAEHYRRLERLSGYALGVIVLCIGMFGGVVGWRKITPRYRARNDVELVLKVLLIICSTIAIFTTLGIVLSVLFEAIRFFKTVPITDFLFGLEWSPQMAIRSDQVGSSGAFGAVPVFTGTLLISAIAMCVAIPTGLMSRDLHVRIREQTVPRRHQAFDGNIGGHPHRCLRILRRAHGGAGHTQHGRVPGARYRLGKRPGRRTGHGHHDHPLRLLPVGRRPSTPFPNPCAKALTAWAP